MGAPYIYDISRLRVNDVWRNTVSTIRLFAVDCVIYRKVINNEYIEKLQKFLDKLEESAAENAMKINLI
jgi:hypothetical protein